MITRFLAALFGVVGVFVIIIVAVYTTSFSWGEPVGQRAVALSAPPEVESLPPVAVEIRAEIDHPAHVVVLSAADTYAGPDEAYVTVGRRSFGDAVMVVFCNPGCSWYELEGGSWIRAGVLDSPPSNLPVKEFAPNIALLKPPEPTATPFVLVLPTVTPTPAPTQPPVWDGAVASDYAIVRRGPGTTFEQMGVALPGAELSIVARNVAGDWYQLKSGAWIAAFLADKKFSDLPISDNIPAPPTGALDLAVTFSNPHYKCIQSLYSYEDVEGETHQLWSYRNFAIDLSIHNLNTKPLLPVYLPTRWILSDGDTDSVQTVSWQAMRSGAAHYNQEILHYGDMAQGSWLLASMEREQWVRAVEFEWEGQVYRVDYDLAAASNMQNYKDCGESRNPDKE